MICGAPALLHHHALLTAAAAATTSAQVRKMESAVLKFQTEADRKRKFSQRAVRAAEMATDRALND